MLSNTQIKKKDWTTEDTTCRAPCHMKDQSMMNILFGNFHNFEKSKYSLSSYGAHHGSLNETNFKLVNIVKDIGL